MHAYGHGCQCFCPYSYPTCLKLQHMHALVDMLDSLRLYMVLDVQAAPAEDCQAQSA